MNQTVTPSMTIRRYALGLCALLFFSTLPTDAFLQGTPHEAPPQETGAYRKLPNTAFDVGEELNYDVDYGFITAGTARIAIPRYSDMNGRKCYNVEFSVTSKPFFDSFYKVRDRYETHIDVEGLFPWKFVQQIREGGYKYDFNAWFDQQRLKALTSKGEFAIEPYSQDALSAFYFMRTQNYDGLRPGQKMTVKNFARDSVYTLTVKYLGKQTIKVEAGKFNCILIEPIMKEGGLFKSSGRIIIWVTDDEKKIPVQIEAEVPIGSITTELTSYKGINTPVRAKVD
jgi:hypothetical protein